MSARAAAALLAAAGLAGAAQAQAPLPNPACDSLIQPGKLSAHSRHPWRSAPGVWLPGDLLTCNLYQEESPAGLSLSVRPDRDKQEYDLAQRRFADGARAAPEFGRDAFYFRLAATDPFAPSWGLLVHRDDATYRLEGVPEAGDAEQARALARGIIERTMKKF